MPAALQMLAVAHATSAESRESSHSVNRPQHNGRGCVAECARMKTRSRAAVAAALAALLLVAALAFQFALRHLRAGIEQALGPRASVEALSLGWSGVEITGLRIRGERGWPAADELRAERVRVMPEATSLFGDTWRVRRIEIEGAYVSLLRSRDGRLRVLPSLLERADATAPAGPAPAVRIGQVRLRGAAVEFFDASVRRPAHRLRLQQLDADVGPLALPALDRPVGIDLKGRLDGPQRDGTVAITGHLTPATRDAALQARLAGVDLIALQPYLLRVNEGGVRRGTLDLRLSATVTKHRLHAPGTITLTGLELGSGGGLLGTFAGVPRQAVVAAMSRDGRIELKFTLEGRLDDPSFSLNEALALRTAAGLAERLGVSVRGVVEGVGSVLGGLLGR